MMILSHRLIITGDSEDPWYVEHDPDCPTVDLCGGGYCFDYVCPIGRELADVGLDPELAGLPVGVHGIEHWQEFHADRYGVPELVDSGIRAVVDENAPLLYTDLDSVDYWSEIVREAREIQNGGDPR